MKSFLEKILSYYSLNQADYEFLIKENSYDDLPNFNIFKNIKETVSFLNDAVAKNKKILIYGDYDCDGIMSTSILFKMFEKKGYKVGYYIPFREVDGYGLNMKNIDLFHRLGYEIIICADNGITLVDEINYAKTKNIECVVLDHHNPREVLPNTPYIIHPFLSNLDVNTSAGGVCYYFSKAFLGYDDPYLLSLAGISLISDLMNLTGSNRILLKLALKEINKFKFPNIFTLLENYKNEIDEDDIGMQITPKINAVGRIIDDNSLFNVVRLFTTENYDKIVIYSSRIKNVNEKRKNMVHEILENTSNLNLNNNVIIEVLEMKEGLTGLIANRFLEKYNKPSFILVKSNEYDNILKGSVRSKENFNVIEALKNCNDILLNYGGHDCAGGFSLDQSNLITFTKKINNFPFNKKNTEETRDFIDINVSDVNKENYKILHSLTPFGQGFTKPLFRINGFRVNSLTYSKDKKHIITKLSLNSSLIYFNYDEMIKTCNFVQFFGYLDVNNFRNNIYTQFRVISYTKIN